VARVVVRQREYLSAVVPHDDALVLILLRYQQELVDLGEFKLPQGKPSDYRVSPREIEMATRLVESMSVPWDPDDYIDDYRQRLRAIIDKRMKSEGVVAPEVDDEIEREGIATNVVDFESLLKKSIADNKRTPARKAAPARKAPAKKARKAAKKPAAKKRKSA
jgi:DNA end-binding protein Ku